MVEKEILAAHGVPQLFRAEVILHIGEADRSRNANGSGTSRQQDSFWEAKPSADRQHVTCLVHLGDETDGVGIVADIIANLVK